MVRVLAVRRATNGMQIRLMITGTFKDAIAGDDLDSSEWMRAINRELDNQRVHRANIRGIGPEVTGVEFEEGGWEMIAHIIFTRDLDVPTPPILPLSPEYMYDEAGVLMEHYRAL